VAAKVRERLALSKQAAQKFDVERFNLRKLNELEVRKQYQNEITNRLTALENLSDEDINRAWENIQEIIKISAKYGLDLCELKQCWSTSINVLHTDGRRPTLHTIHFIHIIQYLAFT
jgi:hypothetical protein